MHIVIVVASGLVALALFFFGAAFLGKGGSAGAAVFIWLWLAAALFNGAYGIIRAGIPILEEAMAFVPIFGIPAVVAWYLAYRYRAGR
jgi:hypothetical protein